MGRKARIRKAAKKLNPIDDLMFCRMAEEPGFCEEILKVFLSDPSLAVLETTPQYTGANLQGRSVILDAKCRLGSGKHIDIEVQNANDDDHQRRVRYNGAVLTTNITDTGQKFKNVPDVCVVFISRFDLFKSGFSHYHINRTVQETGRTVVNGFEEIYVNAKVKDGSAVSELMEVFVNDSVYNKKFPITSSAKHRYKKTEEGLKIMCEIMEQLAAEERKIGERRGKQQGRRQGRREGRKEGRREGQIITEKRINTLNTILLAANRIDDLKRSAADSAYQKQLMAELLPK